MATQPPSPTTPLDRNAPPHAEPLTLPETRSRAAASTDRLPIINTEDEIKTLETFLNVNMGTQEYRDYKRKVSYYRLWTQLAITVFLQSCLCFAFLAFFVWVRPAKNQRNDLEPSAGDRWPNIRGLDVVLTVIGTVTTCAGIKIVRRVRAESSRRPPRHRRDACSMAWRCRFLAARPSQVGRVIAEK